MKNIFICRLFIVSFLALATQWVAAQQPVDSKFLNAQMAKAQHIIDSVKKLHPEIANADLHPPKALNIDSVRKATATNMANLQNMQDQARQQRNQALPAAVSGSNAFGLKKFSESDLALIAQKMIPVAIAGLNSYDLSLKSILDESVNDPKINVAGTGMLLAATGLPKFAAQYMVCKSLLQNSKNVWTLNDLGIILRNENRYPEAIQCFSYACSFSDSLYIIKTNLGWATAYYGDLDAAKKYFNEALAINHDFGSAMEGLATIAYQQGDIQALFDCLSKEVKGFGGGGPGPSEGFTNVCGGVAMDQQMNNMGKQNGNPGDDHTYDNNSDPDDGNQDAQPTAGSEPPNYPSMSGIFAQSLDDLLPISTKAQSFMAQIKSAGADIDGTVAQIQAKLPRLAPPPYTDGEGNLVSPYSYQKFYTLFHNIHESFEQRLSYIYKQFNTEMDPLLVSVGTHDADMAQAYIKDMGACKATDEKEQKKCINEVQCKWKPIMRGSKAADLAAISGIWTRYIQQVLAAADWYVAASTPFIKRVHQPDWNDYMNKLREQDVRHAVLIMYTKWLQSQGAIGIDYLHNLDIVCRVEVREIPATGPDPKDVKVKKLKTAPDYCDDNVSSTDATVFGYGYKSDCSGTTVTVPVGKAGPVDVGLVFRTVTSRRHKEDDYSRIGLTLGVGVNQKIGADGAYGSGASIKGSLEAKVEAGYQFGSDGSVSGKYADLELSAGVSGKATTGNDDMDALLHTAKFNHGLDVKVELMALNGGNWGVTGVSGTRH